MRLLRVEIRREALFLRFLSAAAEVTGAGWSVDIPDISRLYNPILLTVVKNGQLPEIEGSRKFSTSSESDPFAIGVSASLSARAKAFPE